MAVSTPFKVKCDSCELTLTVNDPALIGKKIYCKRCKYAILIQPPSEDGEGNTVSKSAKADGDTKKIKKSEVAKATGDAGKAKPGEKAEGDDGKKKKKKKKAEKDGKSTLLIGGAIGILAIGLVIGGYFAFFNGDDSKPADNKDQAKAGPGSKDGPPEGMPKGGPPGGFPKDGGRPGGPPGKDFPRPGDVDPKGPPGGVPPKVDPKDPTGGDVKTPKNDLPPLDDRHFSNLLPEDSQWILSIGKDVMETPFGGVLFEPTGSGKTFRKWMGFGGEDIDQFVLSGGVDSAWVFGVVKLKKDVAFADLQAAMELAPKKTILNRDYYTIKSNELLKMISDYLAAELKSQGLPVPASDASQTLSLNVLDARTLVIADTSALEKFLKADAKRKNQSNYTAPGTGNGIPGKNGPPGFPPPAGMNGQPPGGAMGMMGGPPQPPGGVKGIMGGPLQPPGPGGMMGGNPQPPGGAMGFMGGNTQPGKLQPPGMLQPPGAMMGGAQPPGGFMGGPPQPPGGAMGQPQLPPGGGGLQPPGGMMGGPPQPPGGGLKPPGGGFMGGPPTIPGGQPNGGNSAGFTTNPTYLTVDPSLKQMMNQLEQDKRTVLTFAMRIEDTARLAKDSTDALQKKNPTLPLALTPKSPVFGVCVQVFNSSRLTLVAAIQMDNSEQAQAWGTALKVVLPQLARGMSQAFGVRVAVGGASGPGFPGNPGGFPGNPGNPGGFPGNPGGFPGNPGGFPGNPGNPGGNPGGFPGNPGNPGGFPGNPGNPGGPGGKPLPGGGPGGPIAPPARPGNNSAPLTGAGQGTIEQFQKPIGGATGQPPLPGGAMGQPPGAYMGQPGFGGMGGATGQPGFGGMGGATGQPGFGGMGGASGRPPLGIGGQPPGGFNGGQPPFGNPNDPTNPSGSPSTSTISTTTQDRMILITLDVDWKATYNTEVSPNLRAYVDLLKGKALMMTGRSHWANNAIAIRKIEQSGGMIPQGAYPRKTNAARFNLPYPPEQRVSWMVELLPHLGYDNVYRGINKEAAWNDEANLKAGAAWIPEFLSPRFPESTWRAEIPSLRGRELGATHFVGLSGVGMDSAEFPDSPEYAKKLGVFGYDRRVAFKDISAGDGASNTIFMIQAPPNVPRAWIRGGGSTVQGVALKNSVKPFVSEQPGARFGTFALMADGSVRFIGADVSDSVFQALVTYKGGEQIGDIDKIAPRENALETELKSEVQQAVSFPPAGEEWAEIEIPELPGKIRMPNNPEKRAGTGGDATYTWPKRRDGQTQVSLVIFTPTTKISSDTGAETDLDAMIEEIDKRGVKPDKVVAVKINGRPGRQFELSTSRGVMHNQLFIAGRKAVIMEIAKNAKATPADVKKYFESVVFGPIKVDPTPTEPTPDPKEIPKPDPKVGPPKFDPKGGPPKFNPMGGLPKGAPNN